MNDATSSRAELLFNEAIQFSPEERSAFLIECCEDDPKLRKHLEKLLQAADKAGNFLPEDPASTGTMAVSSPQPLGTFGDYDLLEEIARGGMGVVYKARQRSLNRIVALKMILAGQFASHQQRARFRVEAEAAARLRHPGIVRIHETGEINGVLFFSMDYIEACSLTEVLQGKPFAARRAALVVRKIADAIQHAHGQGVLHRDLKPSNVLLNGEDEPCVTDFGLAKRTESKSHPAVTLSGQILGSPEFIPPEQASPRTGKTGVWSDIYSLGGVLYYLLTGRPPFVGQTVPETLDLVLKGDPLAPRTLIPGIPSDLETICLKCLEKNPERRYLTATALGDDLQRWLDHKPILARPASLALRLNRWTRRNLAGASVILSLVLGLGIALALLTVVSNQRKSMHNLLVLRIDELWQRPDSSLEVIRSEELAALTGRPSPLADSNAIRLRMGIHASTDPVSRAKIYQPLIEKLEHELQAALNQVFRIDLVLFKPGRVELEAVGDGAVDISRLGALSFTRLTAEEPDIIPLVQEADDKPCVIFAGGDSGISHLQQLRGRSFGVADAGSTISLLGKASLLAAGFRKTDLNLAVFDGNKVMSNRVESLGVLDLMHTNWSSHAAVLEAVIAGSVDAGVARKRDVLARAEAGLVILHEFESLPNLWVVRSGFPDHLIEPLREGMLSLEKSSALSFKPVDEAGLAHLRESLVLVEQEFGSAMTSLDSDD